MLFFGREPKLPIDIAFGLKKDDSDNKRYSEYITDLQGKIKDVFDIVNRNADKARDKHLENSLKCHFDKWFACNLQRKNPRCR